MTEEVLGDRERGPDAILVHQQPAGEPRIIRVEPVARCGQRDLAEKRLRVALDEPLERVTAVCPFKKCGCVQSKTAAGDRRDGTHRQATEWDKRHTDDAFVPDGGDLNHGAVLERGDQRDHRVHREVHGVDRSSRFEEHRFPRESNAAGSLEQLPREDPAVTVVGVAHDTTAMLRLIDQNHVDAVVVDTPPLEQLADWRIRYDRTAFMVLVDGADEEDSLDALYAGARAILPRSAEPNEIASAIKAVIKGFAVLPHELLTTLLKGTSAAEELPDGNDEVRARLTPRELEVLAAMADGVSNKAIARRLGISFHTAKFHVAAILAKLNADSRTEAVTKAAQLGLVML